MNRLRWDGPPKTDHGGPAAREAIDELIEEYGE